MKKSLPFFIILILVLCHFCFNYEFLKKRIDYSGCDTVLHLINKAGFHNRFIKTLSSNMSIKAKIAHIFQLRHISGTWPPMLYFVSFLISSFFGVSTFVTMLSNILYLAVLFFGVYFLGKKIGNQDIGLLAVFIVSSFSLVLTWSRRYGLDLPLTSLTPWTIICLLNTNGFKETKRSILFGVFLGFVTLYKPHIFVFIAWPLLYVLFSKDNNDLFAMPRPKQFINVIVALSLTIIIFFIWLNQNSLANMFYCVTNAVVYAKPNSYNPPCPVFSWEGFSYYLKESKIDIFYIIFLLFALVHGFLRKENQYYKNILLFWIFFPYMFFTLMVCKWGRWYLPSLPGIALLISLEVNQVRLLKIRRFLVILIVLFGLTHLLNDNFPYKKFQDKDRIFVQNICPMLEKISKSNKDLKLAICYFDGSKIYNPYKFPESGDTYLCDLCRYLVKLYIPRAIILGNKDPAFNIEADFIIIISVGLRDSKALEYASVLYALENNIVPEQEFRKIFNMGTAELLNKKKSLAETSVIKEVQEFISSHEDLRIHPRIMQYYTSLIKKGFITIDQCAQILKLSKEEIISWVDNRDRNGLRAIMKAYDQKLLASSICNEENFTKRLKNKMVSLLNSFTVIDEAGKDARMDIILLVRKDNTNN